MGPPRPPLLWHTSPSKASCGVPPWRRAGRLHRAGTTSTGRLHLHLLPGILSKVADAAGALPRVLVTDRGSCFYHGATGHLVKAYQDAVGEQGFRSFAGDDGAWQPPDIPDVLVHETVAAWFRKYLSKHPWKLPGNPTAARAKFVELAKNFAKHANKNYDVDALCKAMPQRLQHLADKKGEGLET